MTTVIINTTAANVDAELEQRKSRGVCVTRALPNREQHESSVSVVLQMLLERPLPPQLIWKMNAESDGHESGLPYRYVSAVMLSVRTQCLL